MKVDHIYRPFEVKTIGEDGTFTGYASVSGNLDLVGDICAKGCFAKTLLSNKGRVPILKQHDTNVQLGIGESAVEDEIGLLVTGRLNMEVQAAREQKALCKQHFEIGAPMGLSIGYFAKDFSWSKDGTRTLKEVELLEYSLTPFPANPLAQMTSIKSILETGDELEIAHKKREIESFLRGAGCSSKQAKSAVSAIFGDDDVADDGDAEELRTELKKLLKSIK